jgi:hypothetical protein
VKSRRVISHTAGETVFAFYYPFGIHTCTAYEP